MNTIYKNKFRLTCVRLALQIKRNEPKLSFTDIQSRLPASRRQIEPVIMEAYGLTINELYKVIADFEFKCVCGYNGIACLLGMDGTVITYSADGKLERIALEEHHITQAPLAGMHVGLQILVGI